MAMPKIRARLEPGDQVRVFDDPERRKGYEGIATLVRPDDCETPPDGFECWLVTLRGDHNDSAWGTTRFVSEEDLI